eukprot:6472376-Amphidinium_carterae.1
MGESPSRVIRRTGAVHKDHLLEVLMRSGTENCNIKPCRPQFEAELNIGTVWAQTMEKDVLLTQLAQLPHFGIIRTKNGKFLVRCLPAQ